MSGEQAVTVVLSADDYAFLTGFHPDRDRTASRADMVRVIEHMQDALAAGQVGTGAPDDGPWRVGEHYRIHVYEGDRTVATFHHPEDAAQAVADREAVRRDEGSVWINPARKSGEPCIGGHRVPVEMVIGAVWDSSVENAMDLWCLTRADVLGACWYAGMGNVVRLHGKGGKYVAHRGPWRKRWGSWAAEVHDALWHSDDDSAPDPPTAADRTTP